MTRIPLRCGVLAVSLLAAGAAAAQPAATAFTYQGRLTESGQPATGLYDFQACLYDAEGGNEIGCVPDLADVPVDGGLFTFALDFGSAPFNGQTRWLELRVRPGASTGTYTRLNPRQPVRPAPEALRANATSAAPWSGLTGVPAGFADGTDDVGGAGTVTSITAGTGLSGGTITGSGTIGIANGGVGSAQIAAGAVGSAQIASGAVGPLHIAAGAVGTAQINTAQVQARINGTCGDGFYVRQVNAAGNVVCGQDANGGGTVTAVATGAGLTGGPINTTGIISIANGGVGLAQINTAQVQARVNGTCAIGEYVRGIHPDGSVACESLLAFLGINVATTLFEPAATPSTPFLDVAIGTDGIPLIVFRDAASSALKAAKCANAACTGNATLSVVDDPLNAVGEFPSVAIGADGLPVISYYDSTAGALKVAKCANAACSGSGTISVVDDPLSNTVGQFTSIAIGHDGLPVISYYDVTATALKVAKCATPACTGSATITTVDDPPATLVGARTAIAVGSDGRPVISYYDLTDTALKVAKCADVACSGPATITTLDGAGPGSNNVGNATSIALGADGLPVIAYRDQTLFNLKVAKCANAACTSASSLIAIDAPADVGDGMSIAIGTDGLPVISYLDLAPHDLKIARCSEADCTGLNTTTGIDTAADVIVDTAIAVGHDGLPVIAYFDNASFRIRVAKCGNRGCQ